MPVTTPIDTATRVDDPFSDDPDPKVRRYCMVTSDKAGKIKTTEYNRYGQELGQYDGEPHKWEGEASDSPPPHLRSQAPPQEPGKGPVSPFREDAPLPPPPHKDAPAPPHKK